LGVLGAETPNRAARAVGHDTAVPNRAGPTAARSRRPLDGHLAAGAPPRSRPSGRASLTHRRACATLVSGEGRWTVCRGRCIILKTPSRSRRSPR